jgi:YbbR domain-containing protein
MKPAPSQTDYKAVIISIFAAIIFWIMNALNKEGYSQKISFPIHFTYNDSLYIPTQPLPERISVNVSGNGWNLLRKSFSFYTAPIQYAITKPLSTKFLNTGMLTDSIAEYIRDVHVNYVVADRFELEFDRKITKNFSLKVDSLHIPLKDHYVVSSLINVQPRMITINGPESILKEMNDTILLKVPGRKIKDNFDDTILLPFTKNGLLKSNRDKVNISFEVEELLK